MPRRGFSAALQECGVDLRAAEQGAPVPNAQDQEQDEVERLRSRIATLEAQLRQAGIVPAGGESAATGAANLKTRSLEPDVRRCLGECGLEEEYAERFAQQGYCDMYTVSGMQEHHMNDLGMLPGHALKLARKIKESSNLYTVGGGCSSPHAPGMEGQPAPPATGHQPGVYRCVHGPRVAVRAAPSRSAATVETLRLGELVRISEVVSTCWGKIDECELWARFTNSWPMKPLFRVTTHGEELSIIGPDAVAPPRHAFVLIDGAEAGIQGPLLLRLSPADEADEDWAYRDAREIRSQELNAAALRRDPANMLTLREKFVETAKGFVGAPFARCFHDPSDPRGLPGSTLFHAPRFVDDVQLVTETVNSLQREFGFMLDARCRPVHLSTMLPMEHEDASFLEPGDLIFYETYDRKSREPVVRHVEIFISGPSGTQTVGSLPWTTGPRADGKDGVQIFGHYQIESLECEQVIGMRFCSIRPWLGAQDASFAHGQLLRQRP